MRLTTSGRSPAEIASDAVVQVVTGSEVPLKRHLAPDAGARILREDGALTWLEARRARAPWVLCAYLGDGPAESPGACGSPVKADDVRGRGRQRMLGATIERACDARDLRKVVLGPLPPGVELECLLESILLRCYATLEFTPDEQASSVESLVICCGSQPISSVRAVVRRVEILADATNFCREIADLPPNVGTPQEIVARVRARAKGTGLRVKVLDANAVERLGMRLVAAVGAGSMHPPCVLIVEHNAERSAELPTVVFVGKGVTHDTGGYNLKASNAIGMMNYDKAGAAATIGAMDALARLDAPAHVVAIMPLVENAIGERAYKPGDILSGPGGTSIYVENTDAEGRLVLADCLSYATRYRPDAVIDIATLTDAAYVALGDPYAALYANDDGLRDLLLAAGRRTGEPLWPMPIDDEHDLALRHNRAHLRNSAGRTGASGIAAAFLRRFVDFPWAHVDMGGRSHSAVDRGVVGPGATGFGTRLLVEAALHLARGGRS